MAKEKKWRRIYLFLMIFVYGIFTPVTVLEWLFGDGRFPLTALVACLAMPAIRKNHLLKIEQENL
ncbi:hypothetical protein D4T97_018470 [Siminovitchia acidinfaciens]|uniref:Uncharacterized protein n=1 Tax=Siminovitchia acidinfaciens TaxID=2321395 RepID=A0A429XU34_9BACI|nr:hypothetical protein [Siminovitchia acidinfaciens]RST71481.1 hypothetical protein D4T97_018470 [Siminovitchia acidinfaciens]